jgi:hypothetical protein
VYAIPHPQERLLHEVFGDTRIAHHSQDEGKRQAPVPVVEFSQGLGVTALQAQDEVLVAGGGSRHQQRQQHNPGSRGFLL